MASSQEACAAVRAPLSHDRKALPSLASGSNAVAHWVKSSSLRLIWQRHHFYRSPARLAHLAWDFVSHLKSQFEIFLLLNTSTYSDIIRVDPIFPFKFLTRDYLVRGLSIGDRAMSFLRHYRRLQAVIPASTLARILHQDFTLLEKEADGHHFSIRACRARDEVNEGELIVSLEVDGKRTFVLQFTVVPGSVVQSEAHEVFLVSRLQGIKGSYSEVRLASKAFMEVAPPALLLAVLHGFAQVFGVEEMAGISAESQFCYLKGDSHLFQTAYDDYWIELGAKRVSERFFAIPIPPQEKSLDGVKNGHKSRTRKKREFRKNIAHEVFCRILGAEPHMLGSVAPEPELVEH